VIGVTDSGQRPSLGFRLRTFTLRLTVTAALVVAAWLAGAAITTASAPAATPPPITTVVTTMAGAPAAGPAQPAASPAQPAADHAQQARPARHVHVVLDHVVPTGHHREAPAAAVPVSVAHVARHFPASLRAPPVRGDVLPG
jgi:hypothetical protein